MKLSHAIFTFALFSLGFLGCDSQATTVVPTQKIPGKAKPTGQEVASDSYVLHRTDALHIEMFRQPDVRLDVSVSQEGKIALPLIGEISVVGLTLNEVRKTLEEKYKDYYTNPQLAITIHKYAERLVYVTGLVNRAGPVAFPIEGKLTLTSAIAGAGGVSTRGDEREISVKHVVDGKTVVDIYDWRAITKGEKPDIELEENDSIYVKDTVI